MNPIEFEEFKKVLTQCHEDTGNREDIQIEPKTCFSNLSDSVESKESTEFISI